MTVHCHRFSIQLRLKILDFPYKKQRDEESESISLCRLTAGFTEGRGASAPGIRYNSRPAIERPLCDLPPWIRNPVMPLPEPVKREHLHTRAITYQGFEREDGGRPRARVPHAGDGPPPRRGAVYRWEARAGGRGRAGHYRKGRARGAPSSIPYHRGGRGLRRAYCSARRSPGRPSGRAFRIRRGAVLGSAPRPHA